MRGIQIIGTQRSGSNLLRLMLNQLEEVCAPHPPHILDVFTPHLNNYGNLQDESCFRELTEDVCQLIESNPVPWKGIELDRDHIRSKCKLNSLLELFRVIYELKTESQEKSIWCCKSMANFSYFNLLEASEIKSFYLHLVRDGRDVASSFKKAVVGEKHSYHLAKQWHRDQSMSDKIIETVEPSRGLRIRYEDLITSPIDTIERICKWLNIKFDVSVLKYYESEESFITAEGGEMWSNLKKPILRENCQKYQSELTSDEVRLFEHLAGDTLRNYQYQLDTTHLLPISLSEVEVGEFDLENDRLKALAQACANPLDVQKRTAQEKLKEKIATRRLQSVA